MTHAEVLFLWQAFMSWRAFSVEPIFYTHNIMKHFTYTTKGTCSRLIDIELNDDNTIGNVAFAGGCHGNLQGISS